MIGKILFQKKEASRPLMCQTVSWGEWTVAGIAVRVDPCKAEKCYVNACTDVSSIPHIVFLESMSIVKRILVFFVSLRVSLYRHSLWHVLHKVLMLKKKYFYQALLYSVRVYFLPSQWKLTRALNLSVFYHDHTIKACWIICTFDSGGPERREGFYFF